MFEKGFLQDVRHNLWECFFITHSLRKDLPMKLTTIIPVHNAEKYITATLDSVLQQDLGNPEELEVICVDDCIVIDTPDCFTFHFGPSPPETPLFLPCFLLCFTGSDRVSFGLF